MRRLYLMVFIVLVFLLMYFNHSFAYEKEIKSISSIMAENISKAGKKTIAVVDFTDLKGNVTELGRFLAEEFSVALAGAGKGFEVVDRTHLKIILQEHKLSTTGLIDPQTAKKLGQIAGVDAIITGSITPFGDSVRVSAKVLATDTAKIIAAASGDIAKTKAIEELLGKEIEAISPSSQSRITPPSSTKPQPKIAPRIEVNDFIFEAKEGFISGKKTTFYVSVTNNEQKIRELNLNRENSIMVDNFGNQYLLTSAEFGTRTGTGIWFGLSSSVIPNLPMNLTLIFDGVVPEAAYANLILNLWSYRDFKAILRNIPLIKRD